MRVGRVLVLGKGLLREFDFSIIIFIRFGFLGLVWIEIGL
jgi:hypothetical protein